MMNVYRDCHPPSVLAGSKSPTYVSVYSDACGKGFTEPFDVQGCGKDMHTLDLGTSLRIQAG